MEYTVGDKIALARKRAGVKQDALAKLIGVSTSTLQKIESGHTSPRVELVEAVATALSVDYAGLVV